MAKSMVKSSIKEDIFLSATLVQTRLASEQISTAPTKPEVGVTELQVKTDTSSGFSVALADAKNPTHLFLQIDYKVSVKIANTETLLAQYEAKHATQFKVINWSGFNWEDIPQDVMIPYFAMVQNIAIRRADTTFIEMGMRGISLPANFPDEPSKSIASTEAASPAK